MTAHVGDTFISSSSAQKKTLRRELRRQRRLIPRAARAQAARLTAQRLLCLRRLRRARHIAVYIAVCAELDTAPLIDALLRGGKRIYAPQVDRCGRMRFVRLAHRNQVRPDALGLAAPRTTTRRSRAQRRLDIVIVPLLGFDAQGHRIGMGAGYYDRAFSFERIGTRPWLLGYAHPQQQTDEIPVEPWDVKLDAVALPTGVRYFTRTS